jgi:cyclomaltodextrinase / maltogenic alpha-amylase / neopullulanase
MHIRFSYQAPTAGTHEVGILGDFTEWKIHPLQSYGDKYLISFELKPGRYRYKLIVDGAWMPDPAHQQRELDPFGGENSVVIVAEAEATKDWHETVQQAMQLGLQDFLAINRVTDKLFELRLKWPDHLAEKVKMKLGDQWSLMNPSGMVALERIWHVTVEIVEPTDLVFEIQYADKHLFIGQRVTLTQDKAFSLNPEHYPIFAIPPWVHSGIIYQIFPDRFHNGDPGLNQNFREAYYKDSRTPPPQGELLAPNQEYYHFVEDWQDIKGLKQNPFLPEGKPDWWCFYGGDIPGVRAKLDYLQDLGITIIYFNPLWEAKSVHKYDAADFRKVDPHFGTAQELKSLVTEAHTRGMRVILDVAFNHSGETFWAFQDCVKHGEESRYWHWYDWFKWPLPSPLPADFKPKEYYQCWWGIKDMPDLNFDLSRRHPFENYIRDIANAEINEDLVFYILDSAEWWISHIGMDGFRLDVPDEVPWWFWELFRKQVKELKPDAWLVGEIWNNATAWVSHKYFDSVMNYAYFNSPVLELFIHRMIPKAEFQNRITEGLGAYPMHAAAAMMNLLGSHDTQRMMHLAKGDLRRVKQAVFFQMTFIGAPHIYYGDEIAMPGGKDPDNRRPFNWNWESDPDATDMRAFYQQCIGLRRSTEVFTEGEFEFVESQDNVLLYRRFDHDTEYYCAINLSAHQQSLKETPDELYFTEGKAHIGNKGLVLGAYAISVFR